MKKLTIVLGEEEFVALRQVAHRERRDPRSQARVIVERAIGRPANRSGRPVIELKSADLAATAKS